MDDKRRVKMIVGTLRELGICDAVIAALSEPCKKRTIADERWRVEGGEVVDSDNINIYYSGHDDDIAMLPDLVRAVRDKMYDLANTIVQDMGVER